MEKRIKSAVMALENMHDPEKAADIVGCKPCFCCKKRGKCPYSNEKYPLNICYVYVLEEGDPLEAERKIMSALLGTCS